MPAADATSVVGTVTAGHESFARHRLYRLMSLSLSITALVEVASVVPAVFAQTEVVPAAYALIVVPAILLPAVIALILFRRASLLTLRRLWAVQAAVMLAAYIALPIVLGATRVPQDLGLTWVAELEIIAVCAAVLAFRPREFFLYAIVWQAVMFTTALGWCENPWRGRAFADAFRQLFFVAMFGALAYALLRAGRMLDRVVDDAVREARRAAAADARRAARDRVQMLVHDRIIVALLAYASGAGPRARAEAASARDEIRQGVTDPVVDRTPRALAWRLQALTTRLAPDIAFSYTTAGDAVIPAAVAVAFEEALGEALRNSLRHAGGAHDTPVTRQVQATVGSERIIVVVLDDGVGFDPDRTDARRLGVRRGIMQRMAALPGGSAQLRSRRGYGTVVSLQWSRT